MIRLEWSDFLGRWTYAFFVSAREHSAVRYCRSSEAVRPCATGHRNACACASRVLEPSIDCKLSCRRIEIDHVQACSLSIQPASVQYDASSRRIDRDPMRSDV